MMAMSMMGAGLPASGIGTAFGLERRFKRYHNAAQTHDHLFENMIAGNPELGSQKLGRHVTIAEMQPASSFRSS
jgi:hypothetical protein